MELLAACCLAITSGVPLLHPDPEPVEGLALATKAVEAIGLLAAVGVLGRRTAARPGPLLLATLVALFSALVSLAVSGGHTRHALRRCGRRRDRARARSGRVAQDQLVRRAGFAPRLADRLAREDGATTCTG